MYTEIAYEAQKAVIQERLRNAAVRAQHRQLAKDRTEPRRPRRRVGPLGPPRFRAVTVFLGVLGAVGVAVLGFSSSALAALPSECSWSGSDVQCTYRYTGAEQAFTVPTGVDRVHVDAIGGRGFGPNGSGAEVIADVAVTPGETLYAEVGGNGGGPSVATGQGGAGGWNGGGSAGLDVGELIGTYRSRVFLGGGGGGASDVRTCSKTAGDCDTLASRLLVAGGGGGFGGSSAGGNAGTPDGEDGQAIGSSFGGGGGTSTAPGIGGQDEPGSVSGDDGTLGVGGEGAPTAYDGATGGGGGGGYYGGGGGAADRYNYSNSGATGGGGGSSYGPTGASFALASVYTPPSVTISYTVASGIAAAGTLPGHYNGLPVSVQLATVQRCPAGASTLLVIWQGGGRFGTFKEASGNSQSDACTNHGTTGDPQSLTFRGAGTSGGAISGDLEGPGAPANPTTVAFTINAPSGGTLVVDQAPPGPLQGSPGRVQPFLDRALSGA